MWWWIVAEAASAQDCPDPAAAITRAESDALSFFLVDAASGLTNAVAAYGCRPVDDPSVLARLWNTQGVVALFGDDPDVATASFQAARAVDASTWNADFGPDATAAWSGAAPVSEEGALVVRNVPVGWSILLDGQPWSGVPASATFHLVQLADSAGAVRHAWKVRLAAGTSVDLAAPMDVVGETLDVGVTDGARTALDATAPVTRRADLAGWTYVWFDVGLGAPAVGWYANAWGGDVVGVDVYETRTSADVQTQFQRVWTSMRLSALDPRTHTADVEVAVRWGAPGTVESYLFDPNWSSGGAPASPTDEQFDTSYLAGTLWVGARAAFNPTASVRSGLGLRLGLHGARSVTLGSPAPRQIDPRVQGGGGVLGGIRVPIEGRRFAVTADGSIGVSLGKGNPFLLSQNALDLRFRLAPVLWVGARFDGVVEQYGYVGDDGTGDWTIMYALPSLTVSISGPPAAG
jgi:hypothetical protein